MSDVARTMDELFGTCRSLVQRDVLDVSEREALFALLREAHRQDEERYEQEWLPYLTEFTRHWTRPLVMLDEVSTLSGARQVAPFARFTISLGAMHRWLRDNDDLVEFAAGLEIPEEIESQEESVAHWMDAFDETETWRSHGDRFEVFANATTGAMITAWYRPGRDVLEEPETVLFGDEGQLVGIAASLQHFALLLAHTFDPFDPSSLMYELSATRSETPVAREDIKRRVEAVFGPVPSREELLAPNAELTAEFEAWVDQFFE